MDDEQPKAFPLNTSSAKWVYKTLDGREVTISVEDSPQVIFFADPAADDPMVWDADRVLPSMTFVSEQPRDFWAFLRLVDPREWMRRQWHRLPALWKRQ